MVDFIPDTAFSDMASTTTAYIGEFIPFAILLGGVFLALYVLERVLSVARSPEE